MIEKLKRIAGNCSKYLDNIKMIEIERKFLVTDDSFKAVAFAQNHIAQGYLSSAPERTVRVRIKGEKGYLTIKDVTKMVELDAEFIGINNYNGSKKAAFEIKGDINRNDFGLDKNFNNSKEKNRLGKNLKLVANLEFSI